MKFGGQVVRRSGGQAICLALLLNGCAYLQPKPQIVTRVDTVHVTREVAPPLPNGDTTTICLGNGMPVTVRVAGADTLVGEQRVKLKDVSPVLEWAGSYLTDAPATITFEKRTYRRQGVPEKHGCDELKEVGTYNGVSIFADVTAPNNLPVVLIPVRPGVFQHYSPETPRRRR